MSAAKEEIRVRNSELAKERSNNEVIRREIGEVKGDRDGL